MSLIKLSSRYAKSLLDLAVEKNKLEEVYTDISLLKSACDSNKELVLLLESPIIHGSKKIVVLEKIFKNNFSEITFEFIKIVINKNRELYLLSMAKQFFHQYNIHKGILPATFITAVPIEGKLKDEVKSIIRKNNAKEIALTAQVDKDIIGGFVLSFGDNLYDASVLHQLKLLKKEFSSNEFVKKY